MAIVSKGDITVKEIDYTIGKYLSVPNTFSITNQYTFTVIILLYC